MNEHKDPSYMDSLTDQEYPMFIRSWAESDHSKPPFFPYGETNTVREEPERATVKDRLTVGFGLLAALGLAYYYLPALLEIFK